MTKGIVISFAVLSALFAGSASYSEELSVGHGSLFSSEEASSLDKLFFENYLSDFGLSSSDRVGDPKKLKHCLEAREILCKIYCHYQTDHSYDDCYDGWFLWDGCIQHLEERCKKSFG